MSSGAQFWKNFEDGPWKWDTSGRYAASGINPGHYFAVSLSGARNELLHYVKDDQIIDVKYRAFAVHGSIDDILDLTDTDNIRSLSEQLGVLINQYDLLGQLVTAATGGTYFTDGFGAYAYERGYSGIMSFSARNIEELQRADLQSDAYYHEDDALIFKNYTAKDMFAHPTNRCVVLFDGAQTVRSIKKFTIAGSRTEVNPFHGMAPEAIHTMSEHYGASYQAERKRYRGCPEFLFEKRRCLRCATTEAQYHADQDYGT